MLFRSLAAVHWWDGLSINRVQDNYVVQWGDANADDKVKAKALPTGLVTVPESEYVQTGPNIGKEVAATFVGLEAAHDALPRRQSRNRKRAITSVNRSDPYAEFTTIWNGWPLAASFDSDQSIWPIHCYGMVGVGRDLSPNTGSGAELYVVIGHAPRHLDRNIALVGRVIEGIEFLSSLPRGHEIGRAHV